MPRQTTDHSITSRAARDRLAPRDEPYWRGIGSGVALGYRRTEKGGSWVVRTMVDNRYRKAALGRADDTLKADGVVVLDYRQAEAKAREEGLRQHQRAAGLVPEHRRATPYTVADAMADYTHDYERRGGKDLHGLRVSIASNILPALGEVRLDRLTQRRVAEWLHELAARPARRRRRAGPAISASATPVPLDAEGVRRRRTSANRVLTTLKAALNHALMNGEASSDAAWKRVKPFREVDSPRIRYLSDAETARLANACAPDLRRIVTAAALTGLRYGEIGRLKVFDFDPVAGTLTVAISKSGKPRHVHLSAEGVEFYRAATVGRSSGALMFVQANGQPWGKSHQFRPLREACAAARIEPAISYHILRHTYASRLARAGVPMLIIASQLGHQDTRMTERHYAHLSPSHVADVIRASFAPLGLIEGSNVVGLDHAPSVVTGISHG